jgi:hypothetical protein
MGRILVGVTCLVLASFLGATALSLSSRGHPVTLPLDDAYIYLQYARTTTDGHPGAYFPGQEISTGATSVIWFGLMTAGAWFLEAGALPAFALALSTLAVALGFWLAYRLARIHGVGSVGAWATAGVCMVTPYWFFGAMNGMETGLYGAALLGGAHALSGGSLGWLVLLALIRPEGSVLALGSLGLIVLLHRRSKTAVSGPFVPRPSRAGLALVALVALATLLLPWILTGGPASAWEAKSLWVEPDPDVRGFYLPRVPYFALRALWFGMSGARPQPPLDVAADVFRAESWLTWVSALFMIGGTILAIAARRGRAAPFALWVAATILVFTALAWDAHHYRYLIPGYALIVTIAAIGWFGGSQRYRRIRTTVGSLALAGLVIGGVTAPRDLWTTMRWLYRGECEQIASNQLRVGEWIHESLSLDARVATHDVGAIGFAGGRNVVDLVGLITPELTGDYRHGEGALWEALSTLSSEARPTHAAVIPAWMPYLARTLWAGERLWTVAGGAVRGPVSQDFEVWQLSWPDQDPEVWPGGNFGNQPRLHGPAAGRRGWEVVDGVDVADLASEAEHDYRSPVSETPTVVRNLGFAPRREPRAVAMEGGRDVVGTVEFKVRARRGSPFLLVMRSASAREVPIEITIEAWSDTLLVPRGEDRFREPAVLVPQGVVDSAIDGELLVRVEGVGYRVFHWWILQPVDQIGWPYP